MSIVLLPRARGFSIVELMVSIVIGMLALVFATRMLLVSEQNKEMSLGASDSMQNGMQALLNMKDDLEQSGFGLNDPILNGCDTVFVDAQGFELATATRGGVTIRPLTSVVITANAGSDEISIYSGTSQSGTGSVGITSTGGSGQPTIDRVPFGFSLGDVVVAANENPAANVKCKLAQITGDPDNQAPGAVSPRIVMDGYARFNSNAENPIFRGNKSRLFNLGPAANLSFHRWSVQKGFLMLRGTNLPGLQNAASATPVIDNIVAIKAQYGFDMRTDGQFTPVKGVQTTGMRVARWSATMIDADGDGVIGDRDDWARVAAVRLGIVARGRNVEQLKGSATCQTTTDANRPKLFGTAVPAGVTAVEVIPELAVSGDLDWRCYRYREFETIVPLRNVGWRPTAVRPV